jgi:hypothetical protein
LFGEAFGGLRVVASGAVSRLDGVEGGLDLLAERAVAERAAGVVAATFNAGVARNLLVNDRVLSLLLFRWLRGRN